MALTFVSFFWSSSLLHYRALAVLLRNLSPEPPPWIARIGAYSILISAASFWMSIVIIGCVAGAVGWLRWCNRRMKEAARE